MNTRKAPRAFSRDHHRFGYRPGDCRVRFRQKDFLDKKVDNELDRIIQSKNRYLNDAKIVVPIISQGDPIGSITILPKEHAALGDTELKIARSARLF